MSVYEYENSTIFEAKVFGHLENGPSITQPPPEWWPLRDQVYEAARDVVAFPEVADFHIIYRHPLDGELSRTRWVVAAELLGPTLSWYEDTSGDSIMLFRFNQQSDIQQFRDDQARPMPWPGLRDVMPAVIAKQALGAGPVDIPFASQPTMEFTAQEVQYSRFDTDDIREPYTNHLYAWRFTADPAGPHEPAVWIVPVGQSTGMKVSVAMSNSGSVWSDFDEPAPEFVPLAPPVGSAP
jgi:hypothetical protein